MQIGYMQIRLIKKYFSINKIEIVHNQLITNYKKVEQKFSLFITEAKIHKLFNMFSIC